MPHCLSVCSPPWSRAARPSRHALDRDAHHGLKPARDGRFNRWLNYFASSVGQAEDCLSATKLILPACSEALGWSAGLSA